VARFPARRPQEHLPGDAQHGSGVHGPRIVMSRRIPSHSTSLPIRSPFRERFRRLRRSTFRVQRDHGIGLR
jgi:hypothetical protein